jgi:hypothetical protein
MHVDDKIKKDNVDDVCGTHGEKIFYTGFWWGNLK